MKTENYKGLIVWQKSVSLTEEVYRVADLLPSYEAGGLKDQMRRAAVSIPANIAEGKGRLSRKECRQFFKIANGSCAELETHLLLVAKLGHVSENQIVKGLDLCDQIQRMLNVMLRLNPIT